MDAVKMTGVEDAHFLFGCYSYRYFLSRYLNFTQPVEHIRERALEDHEILAILDDMPQYPDDKSIGFIGDKIYVKFSDLS